MHRMTLDTVLSRLRNVKRANNGWVACCPAHNDDTPSLSVTEGDNGRVLLYCHAGCAYKAIIDALRNLPDGITAVTPALKQVSNSVRVLSTIDLPGHTVVAQYDYTDALGVKQYCSVRYEPKTFRQYAYNGNGELLSSLGDTKRLLYALPLVRYAISQRKPLFFVEGEKDATNMIRAGYYATCIGGATVDLNDDMIAELTNATLIIIPDNDTPGHKCASRIGTLLQGTANVSYLVLDTRYKDVSDYLAECTREQLDTYIDAHTVSYDDYHATIPADYHYTAPSSGNNGQSNTQLPPAPPQNAFNEGNNGGLPTVLLPYGGITNTSAAGVLGQLLADTGEYYIKGGALVRLNTREGLVIEDVQVASLPTEFERVAHLERLTADGPAPANCNESTARIAANSAVFKDAMPILKGIANAPVLVMRGGALTATTGYCPVSMMYSRGAAPQLMPVDIAVKLISNVLRDYDFPTPGDRARALAAIITPAAIRGNLLGGRAPIDLSECDGSQGGKSYRHKLTAAIYNEVVDIVTQTSGRGIGSIEESISAKLLAGSTFISVDNLRGKLDSPMIEALATEDTISVRIPHRAPQTVDPRRTSILLTSNKADITRDLANRSSVTRIRSRGFDHVYTKLPEGDMLDHVRANQHMYYSAVYTVLHEWVRLGRPVIDVTEHSFRAWAGGMGWIVMHLFDAGDILAGHADIQDRMTSPHINWLRDVIIAALKTSDNPRDTGDLRAHEILEILLDNDLEVIGLSNTDDPDDETVRKRLLQGLGRRIAKCYRNSTEINVDGYTAYRSEHRDTVSGYRVYKTYRFVAPTTTL